MRKYYIVHAWNITRFLENGQITNGEKYYGSRSYLAARIKCFCAQLSHDYVEMFTAVPAA